MSDLMLVFWVIMLMLVIFGLFQSIENKQEREELEANNTKLEQQIDNLTVRE